MASFTMSAQAVVSSKASRFNGERVVATGSKRAVACKAVTSCSLESRREALSLMVGAASLIAVRGANAADPPAVPIKDFKTVNQKGFQEIYEARELDNDNKPYAGNGTRFALKKLDLAGTKARVTESEKRIKEELPPLIEAEYYPTAQSELRRQCGYLRFDLNALIETLPKTDRKAAKAMKDDLIDKIEALDFELRQKDKAAASAAFDEVISAFSSTSSSLL